MSLTRKFAGITLRKTIGNKHHRWVAILAKQPIKFTPILGYRSNKPLSWYATSLYPEDQPLDHTMHGTPCFYITAPSLSKCVALAQVEAWKRMKRYWNSERMHATPTETCYESDKAN